jgi:hypothetical protein
VKRKARRPGRRSPPAGRWRLFLVGAAIAAFAVLVGVNLWLQSQPPRPDDAALHADLAAGRSEVEVTFTASVLSAPVSVGDHERIDVQDSLGDPLELDYNTSLGEWIPAKAGDKLTVHGRLYIDSGRAGVHCLHARTSSGCPLPGWVELAGTNYS